jgi:hypothetical protein
LDRLRLPTPDECDRFERALIRISHERQLNGIGTRGEKTLHAVLKWTFDEDLTHHEQKIGPFVADVFDGDRVTEIQTRQFNTMRSKLDAFLPVVPVSIVYPMALRKWLVWLDPLTGEATKRRLSPKRANPLEVVNELYKISAYLDHPHLAVTIVLLELEEQRWLSGWSDDKKKGSRRHERMPIHLEGFVELRKPEDYVNLLPLDLPEAFTSAQLAKHAKVSLRTAQTALRILERLNQITHVGKDGRHKKFTRIG